jgi:hypothetical protein
VKQKLKRNNKRSNNKKTLLSSVILATVVSHYYMYVDFKEGRELNGRVFVDFHNNNIVLPCIPVKAPSIFKVKSYCCLTSLSVIFLLIGGGKPGLT